MLMSNLRCVLDIDYLKRTDTTNDRSQKAEKHHDDIVISLLKISVNSFEKQILTLG